MSLEKLDRKEWRLIVICAAVAAVSLTVGVKYYFLAFPEASIDFRVTKEGSLPLAESFASRAGLDVSGYRRASRFDFDEEAKTFLERELGVAGSGKLLDSTIRLWRWQHRWFKPLQKEEIQVELTTKGEPVGLSHLLPEESPGPDLPPGEARRLAEEFLAGTMSRPLDQLTFLEGSFQKRPHRTDHSFTWKLKGSEVKGADYRIEVGVAGGGVARYREYLKIPDAWTKDYKHLRSKNELTGLVDFVALLLTFLAMIVVIVLRLRRGDIRWKPASLLAGVTFVLVAASQLNSIPSDLYSYDTTTSLGGFFLERSLGALARGALVAAVILLIAAAAEPLYRERFPKALSLGSLLRLRALRTKEFFIASLAGITATLFFFAYENVFYIIANALGAWAPREVNYSDLLSTAFPWIYVLFFGWFPAISEEFTSRMFSIPFFESLLRSRAAAIVLAAVIWGFGHAAYPNQPFWIRGVEVGLAGILFGLIMMRFGIVAVVICHFSVDALYTAFVLIRSANLYYKVSGALSAGAFGILFLWALGAYLLKGGFLPAEGTNEQEGTAPPAEPAPAAEAAPPPAPAGYAPLSRRRSAAAVAIGAGLIALRFVPLPEFGDWTDFATTPKKARQSAETFLRSCGFDVSGYRSAVIPFDRTDPIGAQYVLQTGGLEAVKALYRDRMPTPLWRARYFKPGQIEEFRVSIKPASGEVVGFERKLPDDAPGATLEDAEARALAEGFLRQHGQDPKAGVLKEQTRKDEKARRDHTLVWDYDLAGAGEAKVRYIVVIQGKAVGSWTRGVKIPEDWQRRREQKSVLTELLRWLKVPYLALVAGAAIFLLVVRIRRGEIPWKFALLAGAAAAAPALVRTAASVDSFWERYDTSIPEASYWAIFAIGAFVAMLLFFGCAALAAGLAAGLHPRAMTMFSSSSRRLYGRDALVGAFVSCGFLLGFPSVKQLAEDLVPSGRLIGGVAVPSVVGSAAPLLSALAGCVLAALFVPALAGIIAGVLGTAFRGALTRALLFVFLVLSFLPAGARRLPEYVLAAFSLVLVAGGAVLLARFVLRDNPLAWLWSAALASAVLETDRLISQSSPFYRANGMLLIAALLAAALWLLKDAIARRPSPS